jgi:hypothetical protein
MTIDHANPEARRELYRQLKPKFFPEGTYVERQECARLGVSIAELRCAQQYGSPDWVRGRADQC